MHDYLRGIKYLEHVAKVFDAALVTIHSDTRKPARGHSAVSLHTLDDLFEAGKIVQEVFMRFEHCVIDLMFHKLPLPSR